MRKLFTAAAALSLMCSAIAPTMAASSNLQTAPRAHHMTAAQASHSHASAAASGVAAIPGSKKHFAGGVMTKAQFAHSHHFAMTKIPSLTKKMKH